ncbi:LPS export ABC transporter ATP-binding protein [Candidatus Marithrix sp. Canyon 246]|uniref:LPS export ABC transporter ATP-binding protein n=1 Tax=Candidatus Marithrix sp. Canyon 246 TaxID=1827136 RepID=UPI00084A01F0|nr:LPS export ABC transporter ATP-binding protein [Candidatus Marithrix sp. Canyon 246]
MSILSAQHLAKQYKSRLVVKDVSLKVNSGEVVGLLGPNGAGKTTSFYMIVGLVISDSGTILLDKQDISRQPMHKRAQMGLGYLPQEPSVFRKLTVADNIMAILEVQKHLTKKQALERLDSLLNELNISHLKKNLGMSLSGGERRRVEIARALASEPRFMLLDEPFAGVDPISVLDIQRIIKHLSKLDIGILITDHNVRETLDICDRAYIVNEGTLIAEGTPENILNNEQVRKVYLGEEFKL